ncbi:unnamed protein product [Symbiodinium natans]|uniref:Uncharacterized protein n=1 Tax=Symbiodinium natans TaxID=878477 RepID=A0A812TSK3_9DINO|nr:unnamed protein product [Symbiodinium natans]
MDCASSAKMPLLDATAVTPTGDWNVYSPAARIVCSTNILWFFIPVAWSWQLPERSVLLTMFWAADVFLLGAALNYWLDGTRYTWKMFLDIIAVVTFGCLGAAYALSLGGMVPYVTAIPGLVFAISFIVNCMQLTSCGGAAKVNTTWLLSFISYRWGGLASAIIVTSVANNATLQSIWTSCIYKVLVVTVAFYLHNLKVWYETLPLNRLKGRAGREFASTALRYILEVGVLCAVCAAMCS